MLQVLAVMRYYTFPMSTVSPSSFPPLQAITAKKVGAISHNNNLVSREKQALANSDPTVQEYRVVLDLRSSIITGH